MAIPVKILADFVSSDVVSQARESQVVALQTGEYVVGYQGVLSASDQGAYATSRNFLFDLGAVGGVSVTHIASNGAVDEYDVGVAGRRIGGFAFAFNVEDSPGVNESIVLRLTRGGMISQPDITVTSGNSLSRPEVLSAENGNIFVTWLDLTTSRIRYAVYDELGTLVKAPADVSGLDVTHSSGMFRTDMTALDNGNVVVSYRGGGTTGNITILGASGTVIAANLDTGLIGMVAVSSLPDGRFFAAGLDPAGGVGGRFFNSNGTPAGGVIANVLTSSDFTAATALHDGRIMVVAQSNGDIKGRIVRADGTFDGAEFIVNTVTTGTQSRPQITTLADGRVIVTWTSSETGTDQIRTAMYDPREEGVRLSGTMLADDLVGSNFVDTILTGIGNDTIHGRGGNDILDGGADADRIYGGTGNDWVYGGASSDTLFGEEDNDSLFGGWGADAHDGGGGDFDYARYDDQFYGDITVSLVSAANAVIGTSAARGDSFTGIEGLIMGGGNDWAYGDNNSNYIYGNQGNDNLFGSNGGDYFDGGEGFDYSRFDDAAYAGLTVDLAGIIANTGAAAGDSYVNVEGLILTGNDDFGYGNDAANYLYGLGGNDTLDGRVGADFLDGGVGNDTLTGGGQNDIFRYGGMGYGQDTVTDFAGGTGAGDQLDLRGSGFASFAAVLASSVQIGSNLHIIITVNDRLILNNFNISNFAADDIIL